MAKLLRYSSRASLQHALIKTCTSQDFLQGTKNYVQAFDARVSRLLAHATMLASYATHDLYVLTCIPTRDRFPMRANLLTSHFTLYRYLHAYHYCASKFLLAATFSGTLFTLAISTIDRHVYNHVTLNNVHCLEWLHFYCCMCLTTWKIHLLEFYFVILVKFFWMD